MVVSQELQTPLGKGVRLRENLCRKWFLLAKSSALGKEVAMKQQVGRGYWW